MGYRDSIANVARGLGGGKGAFLITGATGLIGSCLIDVLICANERYQSDYVIYALGRSRKKIIDKFGGNVIPIIQDVTEPLVVEYQFDYIVHAASNADPTTYATQPVETILTNIIGCKNVFEYGKCHKEARILLTSTFEVYGKIENVDVYTENMVGNIDFQKLRNGYPESKRCAEMLLNSYVEEYGVNGVIARLCSIYGPTMSKGDSKAHAQFLRNAISGDNIVLKSKGLQKRTYCYVVDAVSAIFTILFKGKIGEVYNISNDESVATIAEVANTIASMVKRKVIFEQPEQIEMQGFSKPQNCILNNDKLKGLGWKGRFTLQKGMKETLEVLKSGR